MQVQGVQARAVQARRVRAGGAGGGCVVIEESRRPCRGWISRMMGGMYRGFDFCVCPHIWLQVRLARAQRGFPLNPERYVAILKMWALLWAFYCSP